MARAFPLLVATLLLCTSAAALSPLEAQTMEAQVRISNTVRLEPTGSRYEVDELTGTLSWYPRQTWLQEVKEIRTSPEAVFADGSYVFQFDNPARSEEITLAGAVKTRNAVIPVRDAIPFPLISVAPEAEAYLAPGEITDMSSNIKALAQELALGKDDAYAVVYALADWTTNNVNYSLASLGQPASQRSSQVIMSRYGKCDELTSLFISMNRAVGIPARFVGGYAYTNSPRFTNEWGGHGWAEVWLPGQGWVPYDVTYGEYGYLDAGHVPFTFTPDAKETSVVHNARGSDFVLQTGQLDITVTPTRLTPMSAPAIEVSLDTPYATVGFGSAVLILASVRNTRDYYLSTRLDLARTTNTDQLSAASANVLLMPYETQTIPFLVRIEENLQGGYLYRFPFRLSTRLAPDATITIIASRDAPRYDASAYDAQLEQYRTKTSQSPFAVLCDDGRPVYALQENTHACTVNTSTSPLTVCLLGNCSVHAVEKGRFTLSTIDQRPGVFTRTYTAQADGKSVRFFVTSRSIEPTSIGIGIENPARATPGEGITATVRLNHSGAMPRNITVTMRAHHAEASQRIDDLSQPAVLTFTMPGRVLRPGSNTLHVTATASDELGTPYTNSASSGIELHNVSVLDRIAFWLEDAGELLLGLFS